VDKRIGLLHGLVLSVYPRHPLYSILISGFYMPAKDIYHDTVKNALIKDGWTITHEQYKLIIGEKRLYPDMTAIRAKKGQEKIIIEIKSFTGNSDVKDLEQALGQYVLYEHVLETVEPEYDLYLAVNTTIYENLFQKEIGQILLAKQTLRLLVFNVKNEVITQWIPKPTLHL
jgi:hypothetical protein